jgi:hypothetical protein
MSENLDLVRSILDHWERADFRSTGWAHPGIEYTVVDGPEPGTWNGLAEMSASVREFMSAWDDYGIKAEDCRELDGGRVLALVRLSGKGKTSGLEIDAAGAGGAEVWHIREGVVVKLVMYWHRERAFADLGLAG